MPVLLKMAFLMLFARMQVWRAPTSLSQIQLCVGFLLVYLYRIVSNNLIYRNRTTILQSSWMRLPPVPPSMYMMEKSSSAMLHFLRYKVRY